MTTSSSSLAMVLCFEQYKKKIPILIATSYILSVIISMFVGWQGTRGSSVIRILQEGQRPLRRVLVALSGLPLLPHTSEKEQIRV